MTTTISDEAIEAAAIRIATWSFEDDPTFAWDDLDDEDKESARTGMRAALEAAQPFMVAAPVAPLSVLQAHRLLHESAEDAPACSCGQWEPKTATRDLEEHEEHVAAMLGTWPLLDRAALVKAIDHAGCLEVGGTNWPLDRQNVQEIADAVLELSGTTEYCRATNSHHGRGPCVFVAGHHDRSDENWTPHANRHGWGWNDQGDEDEA